MVTYTEIKASNERIATALPAGMVAVFVGGTSGIGEYAMKAFAKHASRPKIYFVGRSQTAADRIIGELKGLNSTGEYHFIQADLSLIKNVDRLCEEIKAKETAINLLFQTQGWFLMKDTEEGIPAAIALPYYGRLRIFSKLLPLVQAATGLKRCISVFAATKEGPINTNDWFGRKTHNPINARGQGASMMTLALAHLAKNVAPDVSFVHDFPGAVRSGIGRELNPIMGALFSGIVRLTMRIVPTEESGETHAFFATSAAFPPAEGGAAAAGVPLISGQKVVVVKGYDGKVGSGVYSIDEKAEPGPEKVVKLLNQMVQDGVREKLWAHTEGEFKRICG